MMGKTQAEPVCACGHLQLVHQDDHSWCWVSTCECPEFDRAENEPEGVRHECMIDHAVGDVFRDPDTSILVRVVSLDPYQIEPIFMWSNPT